jgi:O-acetyl-ADP-ribose deacetylase (regulator of RNase III)
MVEVNHKQVLAHGQILEICQGDLTATAVDAIVNAANSRLAHGGGVAAAIARKGGSIIQQESTAWVEKNGLVSHSQPAYTSGGNLPCKYVIHAVGPIWGEGGEEAKLAAAITGSLETGDALKLHSIAFPAISTGIFGFPKELAASIFMDSIPAYFSGKPVTSLQVVKIVLYDASTLAAFMSAFQKAFHKD